jgi:hypothetical protein
MYNSNVGTLSPPLDTSRIYSKVRIHTYCSPSFICRFSFSFPFILHSPSLLYLTHALRHVGKPVPLLSCVHSSMIELVSRLTRPRGNPAPMRRYSRPLSRGTKAPIRPAYIPLSTPRGDQKELVLAASARNINHVYKYECISFH